MNISICDANTVSNVVLDKNIKAIITCLGDYRIADILYSLSTKVLKLDHPYWSKPENWLKLVMEDVEEPKAYLAPTKEEVVKGITFGTKCLKENKPLLVHCQLGFARSPAIAIGSVLGVNPNIEQAYATIIAIRPRIAPNRLIIKHMDEFYGMNGELITYNEKHIEETKEATKKVLEEMLEFHSTDSNMISAIMEQMSVLNRASYKKLS